MSSLLLERESDLATLEEALLQARDGKGSSTLLTAPAGLGKTRLLAEVARRAPALGLRHHVATARELDRDVAFGAARELFGAEVHRALRDGGVDADVFAGAAALARPLFGAGPGDDVELGGLIHGLYWLTANLAEQAPLALVVDDAQWLDDGSVRWLAHLTDRVEDLPVALVIAARSGEPELDVDPLAALLDRASLRIVRPQPLTPGGVMALVADRLDQAVAPGFGEACADATGGNPFLTTELAVTLALDGVEPQDDRIGEVLECTPDSVNRRLARRIAHVGEDAVAFTQALAVLGDETPLERVTLVAGLPAADGARVVDALAQRDLVRSGARPLFAHAMVRRAVLAATGPATLVDLHRRAAPACDATGAPADVTAQHLLAAPPADVPWAVEVLQRAAEDALRRGAPPTAVRFLDRAVELAGHDASAALLVARARGHRVAGLDDAAELLHARADTEPDPLVAARLLLESGRAAYSAGLLQRSTEIFIEAIERAGGADPELELEAEALHTGGALLIGATPEVRGRVAQLVASDGPGRTPGERALLAGHAVDLMMNLTGTADEALRIARRGWADGKLLEDEGPAGITWSFVTGAMAGADAYAEEEALLAQVLEAARTGGSIHAWASASYCRACPLYFRGMLSDALADAEAALATYDDGWRVYYAAAAAFGAQAQYEMGDLAGAERTLARVDLRDDTVHTVAMGAWYLTKAITETERGRLDEVRELVGRMREVFGALDTPIFLSDWRTILARVEVLSGNPHRAVDLLQEQLHIMRAWGTGRVPSLTHRELGLVVRGDAGLEHTARAVDLVRGTDMTLPLGLSLWAHGTLLRETGRKADAEAAHREALELAAECGAGRLERLARDELLLLGRRPRRTARHGAGSLTAAERRVALLAAGGLTNREIAQELFVTTKTVEKHLAGTFAKLGIASRQELAGHLPPSA